MILKARREIEQAKKQIEAMRKAQSLDEFEEHWISFLHNLERSWNKAKNQLQEYSGYQGWNERGLAKNRRKKDMLLSYLVNARGADEHTVKEITEKTQGRIGINPAHGNSLYIKSLTKVGSKITIDSPQPIKVTFSPARMKLIPVINRGRKYKPPKLHLGKKINSQDPIKIAELATRFYEGFFEKAESKFSNAT